MYKVLKEPPINSCGIQPVSVKSDEGSILASKLGAEKGDKIARDHVRVCKCGERTIVYAYTDVKVIKYCENCKNLTTTYNEPHDSPNNKSLLGLNS